MVVIGAVKTDPLRFSSCFSREKNVVNLPLFAEDTGSFAKGLSAKLDALGEGPGPCVIHL